MLITPLHCILTICLISFFCRIPESFPLWTMHQSSKPSLTTFPKWKTTWKRVSFAKWIHMEFPLHYLNWHTSSIFMMDLAVTNHITRLSYITWFCARLFLFRHATKNSLIIIIIIKIWCCFNKVHVQLYESISHNNHLCLTQDKRLIIVLSNCFLTVDIIIPRLVDSLQKYGYPDTPSILQVSGTFENNALLSSASSNSWCKISGH